MDTVEAPTTPLLPTIAQSSKQPSITEKQASVPSAVLNVSTSIIGAGIMSVPATLKVLGAFPAFLLIVVVAVLVDISVEFMLRFTNIGKATTYAGMMRQSFGSAGSFAVQICVLITNLGCLIIYLIIIGDVLSGQGSEHLGVLQKWFGDHWWNTRAVAVLFILIFVMLPLVMFRRVESLSLSSAIAVLLAVVFVLACSGLAIYALARGESKSINWLPKIEDQASFFKLFTSVPVIVTAFTFHFNVHAISSELGKPVTEMATAVRISLVLCAAIYFATGIFGYILFGDDIASDILVNFDQDSVSALGSLMNYVVRLSYALHLMLTFPLLNFSLRTNIDELLFPNKNHSLATDNKRFVLITVVILAFSYVAAVALPDIWVFFQFMGSTSAVSLAFILPGAVVVRDVHGMSTRRDKIIAATMIILAVVTSIIAISSNVYSLIGN